MTGYACRDLVQNALEDRQILTDPPLSEQEWGFFADTAAITCTPR